MARNISKGIVIVNEFTIHGSRGKTPGRYVIEYMARDGASENLTPTVARSERIKAMEEKMHDVYRRDVAAVATGDMPDYITRYMARDTATDIAFLDGVTDTGVLREAFEGIQGYAGLAFGPDSISLSHKEVLEKARMVQEQHDMGKPVLKTVISFETDYLKEMGALPADFDPKHRGDFYGKSDQAKLRLAVQHGLANIAHEFSDLDYIGLFQVDTMHLHCHLAMVDKGPGKRFTKNGEQRGMLDDGMKMAVKRGIDNSLDQSKTMKPLSIQMEGERRNTIGYIKRFTHRVMEERGLPQYLLACLPKDDKSLWKASINTDGGPGNEMEITKGGKTRKIRGNMKKANEIVRSYVIDLLNRPDSGFAEAMTAKHLYLEARRDRGDFDEYYAYRKRGTGKNRRSRRVKLTPDEAVRDQEIKFRDEITERGMNAVYDVLKGVDDSAMTLHTPLLDAMCMPYEEMANYIKDDKLIEFGFRLRSYASRLDYHKKQYELVSGVIHQYEDGKQESYDPKSNVLYDFLKVEQDYNHALMDKYRSFLHFYHVQDEYKADFEDVMALRHRSYNRHAMKDDRKLLRGGDGEKIEARGLETYGLHGASLLVVNPAAFQSMMEDEDEAYRQGLRNFRERLAGIGMLFDEDKSEVIRGLAHEFDDVKAYDLHHMSYDFTYDFKIALENVNNFVAMADRRYDAAMKAQEYLEASGQEGSLDGVVNFEDIRIMKELADEYRTSDRMYKTRYDDAAQLRRNTATIRLDDEIYSELGDRQVMGVLRDTMDEIAARDRQDETDLLEGLH